MKRFDFEKDFNGNWYVVMPEWEGLKEELQMVMGADTMLDIISNNTNKVTIDFDTKMFEDASMLELYNISPKEIGGGDYFLETYQNKDINLKIWLCSVTEFVFGYLPFVIYFKKFE